MECCEVLYGMVISFVFQVCNILVVFYKVMGGFVINGVNMIKFESYMVDGFFIVIQFYVEVEGYFDDVSFKLVLDELGYFISYLYIFGVYFVVQICYM